MKIAFGHRVDGVGSGGNAEGFGHRDDDASFNERAQAALFGDRVADRVVVAVAEQGGEDVIGDADMIGKQECLTEETVSVDLVVPQDRRPVVRLETQVGQRLHDGNGEIGGTLGEGIAVMFGVIEDFEAVFAEDRQRLCAEPWRVEECLNGRINLDWAALGTADRYDKGDAGARLPQRVAGHAGGR
ncbi:hypothetical protein [Actinoplanes awajinensis]|uniref:hypothetical protein n=1 Tax=Actinoplanes awajinensis TaxID=135946 RepID=UPI001E40B9CC|nr:hypothetical protein [Actinoplanes awajinensis]